MIFCSECTNNSSEGPPMTFAVILGATNDLFGTIHDLFGARHKGSLKGHKGMFHNICKRGKNIPPRGPQTAFYIIIFGWAVGAGAN